MSRWWDAVRAGRPLSGEMVIDAHAHMGPWFAFAIPRDPWAAGMVRMMDIAGIRAAIVAPHVGIGPDPTEANRIAVAASREFPGRIYAYCCITPNAPERAIVAELERMLLPRDRPLAVGIKIHPTLHAYPVTGDRYRPMWEFAQAHGIPVLAHTWEGNRLCAPSVFRDLATRYPAVPVILGHSGGTYAGIEESLALARDAENVWCDITTSYFGFGVLERMVREIGAGRILFGTDLPFIGNRAQIGHVASAEIGDAEKALIFGGNAARLFTLFRG